MTLPEKLVGSIKLLVKAHDDFKQVLEELHALSAQMQGQIDYLVVRKDSLDASSPYLEEVMKLPRAIIPTGGSNGADAGKGAEVDTA